MSNKVKAIGAAFVVIVAIYGALNMSGGKEASSRDDLRELSRVELELREDDLLYVKGEEDPFSGKMVEYFSGDQKRSHIEVSDGRLHGVSRGWYENGQMEVEETFRSGVSHGVRTRWYQNGIKKSEAQIVNGEIEGVFRKWHDNGRQAAKATMVGGVAHGSSESWFRSGERKSHVVLEKGEVVKREFFEDRKFSQK